MTGSRPRNDGPPRVTVGVRQRGGLLSASVRHVDSGVPPIVTVNAVFMVGETVTLSVAELREFARQALELTDPYV